jgi:hypothetical protein
VSGVQARLGAIEFVVSPLVVVVTVPPVVQTLERVVVLAPAVAGFARTLTVQVPEAARFVVPQSSLVMLKSVEFESVGAAHPVAVLFPRFESVKA